jgi:hypothetical protein
LMLDLKSAEGRLFLVAVFAAAMGYVEGVVVVYLKALLPSQPPRITPSDIAVSLGVMVFLGKSVIQSTWLETVEKTREAATIIMLLVVAFVSGEKARGRVAAFFFIFGVWDLMYYATLHLWLGWPSSLLDMDVYFLIPVPWAGPVLTPIVISTALAVASAWAFLKNERKLSS